MLKKMLKMLLSTKQRERISYTIFINKLSRQIEYIRKNNEYCVVFISTPSHGNLGDQAIVYSQERFFKDRGLGKNIVEIPSPKYSKYSSEIKKYINEKDLIVIDGGGNMGTLWLSEEHKMQHIVHSYPNNPIIIFPQTIYYSDDSKGKEELQRSVKVYSAHENLHICAREKSSYEMMKRVFPKVDILLIPDIVLYLNNIDLGNPRNGAILCMRMDKEKTLSEDQITQITIALNNRDFEICIESTVIPESVQRENRIKKLNEKFETFSRSQIVITDRLHGMIFAAITGTPCLAFDNSSRKVGNVYEWIKKIPYIHFANDDTDIESIIDNLLTIGPGKYDNELINIYYDDLFNVIERALSISQKTKHS